MIAIIQKSDWKNTINSGAKPYCKTQTVHGTRIMSQAPSDRNDDDDDEDDDEDDDDEDYDCDSD